MGHDANYMVIQPATWMSATILGPLGFPGIVNQAAHCWCRKPAPTQARVGYPVHGLAA